METWFPLTLPCSEARSIYTSPDRPLPRYGQTGAATTMTLGRRGHYASLRAARAGDTDQPLLGPNQGQYATLSKGCKTLQNDDFY